jgi:ABC-type antimicrobial peptide transport system permease subunit
MIQTSIEAGQLVDPVRQVLQQLGTARSLPEVATLHEVRTGGMAQMTRVSGLVGGLALLLASVGLFGSMAFTSRQRTREMGIRLALGASRGRVARIIVRDGLEIVAIGCTVGLILVLAAFQLLTGLIFGKWTLDLVSLGIVASVFGLVAFAACWLPARRASRIDPMTTLRNE